MKKVLIIFAFLCFSASVMGQLTMNNALTPTQLVTNYLLGAGVNATNITYTGSSSARAAFTCAGACNLGFGSGILLSSGQAVTSPGGGSSVFVSTVNGTAGDYQLDSIINPRLSQDAAILEFDFEVATDSVKFEYSFGSEEYNDYAAGSPPSPYNDVFAFFISGPGIVGQQNLAVVPTTTIPVSINTINNGYSPGVSSGPCTNCNYFVDNITGTTVYFDGFTTGLVAKARVQPCQVYHIKLAIADATDGAFDSGVFLKAGSFTSFGQISLYADGIAQADNATVFVCTGDSVELCLNPAQSYNWANGATTQCITVTEQNLISGGTYNAAIFNPATGCFTFTSNLNVQFVTPSATITPSGPLALCPGSNVTLTANAGNTYLWNNGATTQSINVAAAGTYTVTVSNGPNCSAISTPVVVTVGAATAQITGVLSLCNGANTTLTANLGQSYLWSNGATTQNINVIAAGSFTVTVTQAGGCTATATVAVSVNSNPIPSITGTLSICQGTNTSLDAGPGFTTYLWSNGTTASTLSVAATGTYTVTVTNASGCSATTSAVVTVNPLPIPAITGTTAFCSGNNSNINAGAGFSSYLWNNGITTQVLSVNTGGNYTVTVTDANNCSASASTLITVNPLPVPNITGAFSFCQGSNTGIDAGAGYSSYLWNTGASLQTLTVTTGNTYTVTVTDANGCSNSDSQLVTVNANPIPAISGITSICQGASTTFTADPGYSSYAWSTGALISSVSLNTSGTYTVTVTDLNGCSGSVSSNLTVNALPVPAITGTTAFCQGLNSNLNAGAGFSSYLWNTGASTQILNVTTAGNYTVTVTNAANCSASTNTSVVVNALPVPAITGPVAICFGNSATLDAGPGYATYLWSDGTTGQTITKSTSGNYTVTVTTASGCLGSDVSTLTVNPLPVPAISGVTVICQGATTILDAGPGYSSYAWSNGATTQTLTTGTAGTVTVTVTDANGCAAPAATSVTVNALPIPVITGVNTFCQGQSSILDAGSGYSAYLWNTGAITRTIPVSIAGNYTVTVTAVTSCTGIDNELVTVNPNPVPVILGGTGICQGTSTTLNTPGSFATYLWSTGDVTPSISVSTAGNYTVTVSSAFGCIGSTSTAMVINPLPSPVINGITAVCQGATTSFDAGPGYSAYLWSNGSTLQTISPGTAGTYTVTVTDANGCQNNTNIALIVNPLPVPAISGDFEFCIGENSNLNAGAGYVNYLWSDGTTTQVTNVTTAGNYIVTVTDNNGCSSSTSEIIVVNPLPVPNITGANAICQGTTTTFNAGNYVNYLWSNGASTPDITTGTAGTYAVTVTDVNGCINSTSELLTVYQLPTASISGVSTICYGQFAAITIDFTGTAPFNSTYTAGGATATYNTSLLTSTVNVNPVTTSTYTLLTVSDAYCQGSVSGSAQITVNPLPEPVISGDLSICDGEITSLAATPGFVSYTWSNSSNLQFVNTGIAGIYVVNVTDINGCTGTSPAANLIVNAVPVVAFTNDTSLTCSVPQVNFTNLSQYDAGSAFEWTFGDGGTSTTANPSHLYFAPGNYPVSLVITTPAGCTSNNASQVEVIFYPLPVADFVTAQGVTNVFNSKVNFVDRSDFAINWLWDFGDGEKSIEQNPEHYYNAVGEFKVGLTITNIAGCVDQYEEIVVIVPHYIPNAFSPNGDGVNDLFYYSGYNLDVANYNMKIFNRWGQLVFTGENENDNWNGSTPEGVTAPQGTYVYRLQVKTKGGKEYTFDGNLNLIR